VSPPPLFRCANQRCNKPLEADHVIMLTTMHMRRFCCVECIAEGQRAHIERILADVDTPERKDRHGDQRQ
jgi:hypothetical protein